MSAAAQTLGLRRQLGRAGGIFLALAMLLLLDGMSSGLRRHPDTFRALPGESVGISANVPMFVDTPDKILVQSAPRGVSLRVDQVMPGYWMGGRLFAGAVEVGPEARPGDRFQFERLGYFTADARDCRPGSLVFNRTATLRDTWAKIEKKG